MNQEYENPNMRVNMNLMGKTIIIQFEPLADNDDEVRQHANNTFDELAAAFNGAVNIRAINKHVQNENGAIAMNQNDFYTIILSTGKKNRVASISLPTPLTVEEKLRLISFIELAVEPTEDKSRTVMHHPV